MNINNIRITPFTGEKGKWRIWSEKFMARAQIKVYDVLITGDKKIPADYAEKKGVSALKLYNKTACNKPVLTQ